MEDKPPRRGCFEGTHDTQGTPDDVTMGTDFFDEDLQNSGRRPAGADSDEGATSPLKRPVSDLNLVRMGRQREDIENQVAASSQELERLRIRQDELEKERRELEDLRRKQDDYVAARRDLSDRLTQSLVMMEKEQVRLELVTEMLHAGRGRFKELREEIEEIDDESWSDDQIREELTKSLALLEESRMEYNSTMARLDAAMADGVTESVAEREAGAGPGGVDSLAHSFRYWLKAGFAFSLPGMFFLVLLVLALVSLYKIFL